MHPLSLHDALPISRGGRVLRAENRYQAGGCDRTPVAALDRSVRLQPATTLSTRIRRGKRLAQAAGDGSPRAVWLGRAFFRRADRTLRWRISGLAVAGASRDDSDR